MQIDFKALEQALAPIEQIGQGEVTFDAGPTTITLRVILPHEQVEAQNYAAIALKEEDEHNAVNYLDRLRIACLSYSVVAVGNMDFRGVEYVETGETLPNGAAVKVPKHKALRQLLGRWTRSTLDAVWAKFGELVQRSEAEAEKAIEYEPSSIQAEIDRVEKRLVELNQRMELANIEEKSKFTAQVAGVAEPGESRAVPASALVEEEPEEDRVDPEQILPTPARRKGPIIPQAAPPPQPAAPPRAVPSPALQPGKAAPEADSSFVNSDDDDSMNAALDAEHQRLLAMRQRAAQGHAPQEDSALSAVHQRMRQSVRQPPHLEAREADQDLGVLDSTARAARQIGKLGDAPVFEMPAQDLSTPDPTRSGARVAINPQTPAGGSRNPRFQSPSKP